MVVVAVVFVVVSAESVGTLKDEYIHNVPLHRVPQIQSANHVTTRMNSRANPVTTRTDSQQPKAGIPITGYLHVPSWIPMLPKLGSILGFSQILL